MKKLIVLIFILNSAHFFAQNLVRNPGFEQRLSCPEGSNQLSRCTYWKSFCNSPDYFHGCSNFAGMAPPNAMWGYQMPHSGAAYSSLVTFDANPDYREVIGNQLLSSLVVGQKYYFSFYANLAFDPLSSGVASNKIGLKFSTVPYSESNPIAINNTAHFYSDSILSDTLGWVRFSGSFIADSSYSYVAIGNFFLDNQTDTSHIGTASPVYSMYYIDDVSVSADSTYNESWTGLEQLTSNDEWFSIFPNPFSRELTFDVPENGPYTIVLYSISGKEILRQQFEHSTTICTEWLEEGIYFYELCNEEGITSSGRVQKE